MVRLKADIAGKGIGSSTFQFHYGTIKSLTQMNDNVQHATFQFHYGTIKRGVICKYGFSQMEFQFHYGTIKRICVNCRKKLVCYFNSTMVRLKASSAGSRSIARRLFQFHYGTIKRMPWKAQFTVYLHFNSTMVRLKGPFREILKCFSRFQFHYGTIKRYSRRRPKDAVLTFQFHYGTIKSQGTSSTGFIISLFQFHYGTIKRIYHSQRTRLFWYFNSTMVRLKVYPYPACEYGFFISIPLWYD